MKFLIVGVQVLVDLVNDLLVVDCARVLVYLLYLLRCNVWARYQFLDLQQRVVRGRRLLALISPALL